GEPADLLGVAAGADDLEEEAAQPLVGPAGVPATGGRRVDLVDEAGPASAGGAGPGLDDEPGGDELGHVLADGVVVEPDVLVDLGDADGPARVRDEPEDGVARRVAERTGLFLERRGCHGCRRARVRAHSLPDTRRRHVLVLAGE